MYIRTKINTVEYKWKHHGTRINSIASLTLLSSTLLMEIITVITDEL